MAKAITSPTWTNPVTGIDTTWVTKTSSVPNPFTTQLTSNTALQDALFEDPNAEARYTIKDHIESKNCASCGKQLTWRKVIKTTYTPGVTKRTEESESSEPEEWFTVPDMTITHNKRGGKADNINIPLRTCCSFECAIDFIRTFVLTHALEK